MARMHSKERKYTCDLCSKTFANEGKLTRHKQGHTKEKKYLCNTCGKSFSTSHNLEIHQTVHSGKKSLFCELCAKTFSHRALLLAHQKGHARRGEGAVENFFSCEVCGKVLTEPRLKKHMLKCGGAHHVSESKDADLAAVPVKTERVKEEGEIKVEVVDDGADPLQLCTLDSV